MFSKLPAAFRRELVRKVKCNYPNIDHIFKHFVEVFNTLNMNSHYHESKEPKCNAYKEDSYEVAPYYAKVSHSSERVEPYDTKVSEESQVLDPLSNY